MTRNVAPLIKSRSACGCFGKLSGGLVLLLISLTANATDVYDPVTNQVTIPTVLFGKYTLENVVANVSEVVKFPSGSGPLGVTDFFDPSSQALTAQSVSVGSTTVYNVVALLSPGPPVTIGSVIGGDSYANGKLTIPSIIVNQTVYSNVVVKVSPAQIFSIGVGLPHFTGDFYSGNALSIALVTVNGKVYSNVVVGVSPSDIVSIESAVPSLVTIPNVVSDTIADATTAIYQADLVLGSQTDVYSATVPSGEIISQTPAAGTSVLTSTSVAVVLSLGAPDTVLYSFQGSNDGYAPYGGVIQASDGNFYGTTNSGGTANVGAVFVLTAAGVESVLYSFQGGSDGLGPKAGLVQGNDGNLYGVTAGGGTAGGGTFFKISLSGVETVLYSFGGGADGIAPEAPLIQATDGNFYGTTVAGGTNNLGTVFMVTPAGVETVLHSFQGSPDGQYSYGGLTEGRDGKLYGTTALGGTADRGTIFSVTTAGVQTVLYSFQGGSSGASPQGGLVQDTDGTFYGTTGGMGGLPGPRYGTAFKFTPAGGMTVLHLFGGLSDGGSSYASLIRGSDGNFYGTSNYGPTEAGTIFRLTPSGILTELHSFGLGNDGEGPLTAGLTLGSDGFLYGTTVLGGTAGNGTVYRFKAY